MKQLAIVVAALMVLLFVPPLLMNDTVNDPAPRWSIPQDSASPLPSDFTPIPSPVPPPARTTAPPPSQNPAANPHQNGAGSTDAIPGGYGINERYGVIPVLRGTGVEDIGWRELLIGTMAAEIPPGFPMEALKAQAVAIRTLLAHFEAQGNPRHPSAVVCESPACCLAYIDDATARSRWGGQYETLNDRIVEAVDSTAGEMVLYRGEPILAAFFAVSGGRTENSSDVWGGDLPYLRSVESAGEESDERYQSRSEIAAPDLYSLLLERWPDADLSGHPQSWFTGFRLTDGDSVSAAMVGGLWVPGPALRSLLGLRSAWFTVSYGEGLFVFHTRGHGHGVGMSQNGARHMAGRGVGYRDILTWYYTGTTVAVVS